MVHDLFIIVLIAGLTSNSYFERALNLEVGSKAAFMGRWVQVCMKHKPNPRVAQDSSVRLSTCQVCYASLR